MWHLQSLSIHLLLFYWSAFGSVAYVLLVKMVLHPSVFQPAQPCQGKRQGKEGYSPFFNWQNLVAEHISFVLILLARLGHVGPCSCKGTWKLKS